MEAVTDGGDGKYLQDTATTITIPHLSTFFQPSERSILKSFPKHSRHASETPIVVAPTHLYLPNFAGRVHSRGHINCIAPNVVLWLVCAYHTCYHRTYTDACNNKRDGLVFSPQYTLYARDSHQLWVENCWRSARWHNSTVVWCEMRTQPWLSRAGSWLGPRFVLSDLQRVYRLLLSPFCEQIPLHFLCHVSSAITQPVIGHDCRTDGHMFPLFKLVLRTVNWLNRRDMITRFCSYFGNT